MYINIHNDKQYTNSGSCSALVEYLEKENLERGAENRQLFFNNTSNNYSPFDVQATIDKNKGRLGKDETKFYTISISPSQEELKHIANNITFRKIDNISQFTPSEFKAFEQALKDYANNVMEAYANNFYRLDKQTNELKNFSTKDLVYFGKVEHNRNYGRDSKEVLEGFKRVGEAKEGLQSHIHIIVSRMDVEQKHRLSPLANARNSTINLNGKKVQVGFNRKDFYQKCETSFDTQFKFKRSENQSFYFRNVMKNNATSVARQLPFFDKFVSTSTAFKRAEGFDSKDPIKALQAVFGNTPAAKECLKALGGAYTPTKLVVDVGKKIISTITKSTLH